jgi:hypothetical protein
MNIGIKQEEIPEDINFPDIKNEAEEVSYVCICLVLDTFDMHPGFLCQYFSLIETAPLLGMKILLLCRWGGLYRMVLCASNFREVENIFL